MGFKKHCSRKANLPLLEELSFLADGPPSRMFMLRLQPPAQAVLTYVGFSCA